MKKLFANIIFVTALFMCGKTNAQDIHISQFYETPLLRNPALAGIFTGDVRFQMVHRNQWNFTGYPYKTTALSGEYKFPIGYTSDFLTIGAQAVYDVAGSSKLKTIQFLPVVNFHKSLSLERAEFLSGGFMAGIIQRGFDMNNLSFSNQYVNGAYDRNAPTGESFASVNRTLFDMAAGLSYNNQLGETGSYYIGMSLYHINKPVESFQNESVYLSSKFQFNAGVHISLTPLIDLKSELNFSKQASNSEMMLGGIVSYHLSGDYENTSNVEDLNDVAVGVGGMVRFKDAFVPVIKLAYKKIEMSVSYDVNVSRLITGSNAKGGYELAISYKLLKPSLALSKQFCPRF
jgi:type IX secretion system PorP/SprF family membrane protein